MPWKVSHLLIEDVYRSIRFDTILMQHSLHFAVLGNKIHFAGGGYFRDRFSRIANSPGSLQGQQANRAKAQIMILLVP